MNLNDALVIAADVVNKGALAALGATAVGIQLHPTVSLALLVVAAVSGTALTHLQPVGSRRAELPVAATA